MKIGIIGLGFVGQLHLKVLEYLKLGIKIECYVYDISPNIAKEFEKNNNCKAVDTSIPTSLMLNPNLFLIYSSLLMYGTES